MPRGWGSPQTKIEYWSSGFAIEDQSVSYLRHCHDNVERPVVEGDPSQNRACRYIEVPKIVSNFLKRPFDLLPVKLNCDHTIAVLVIARPVGTEQRWTRVAGRYEKQRSPTVYGHPTPR